MEGGLPVTDFQRDQYETEIAQAMAKALLKNKRLVKAALGDSVNRDALTNEVWDTARAAYGQTLEPLLEVVFAGAATASSEAGVGLSWDLINERAAAWARQYASSLANGLVNTEQRVVYDAVTRFYEERLTLGDLNAKLERLYGSQRAADVAITETTRAAVEGDRIYVAELAKMGARMRGIVETNADERVCSVCGPKQGTDVSASGYPPYHTKCRCTVRYVSEVSNG